MPASIRQGCCRTIQPESMRSTRRFRPPQSSKPGACKLQNANCKHPYSPMKFSSLADSLVSSKNPLYVLHEELTAAGRPVLDLVKGNVNEHGIVFPSEHLKEIFSVASDAARVYRPDSFGQPSAR